MIQEQAKLMLLALTQDKRKFNNFYKKGFFSYSKDYIGKVAIVNKALISLIEDPNDEARIVATASFQYSGTFIYKLLGKNYSFNQFGQDPTILTNTARIYLRKKEDVIQDINSIRKHCKEAEKKASTIQKVPSIVVKFNKILVQSDNTISSQDALLLLKGTLDGLNKLRNLNEVERISDLEI